MTTATLIIVFRDRNSQPTWLQLSSSLETEKSSLQQSSSLERQTHMSTHVSWDRNRLTTATTIIVSWDRNSQPTWLQLQQSSSLETETVNPHDYSYNNHRLFLRQKQSTHMTAATTIIVSWDRNSQPTWLQLQQSSSLETETVNPHDYSVHRNNTSSLSRQKQSTHMTTATTIIVSWDRNSQPTWLQRH